MSLANFWERLAAYGVFLLSMLMILLHPSLRTLEKGPRDPCLHRRDRRLYRLFLFSGGVAADLCQQRYSAVHLPVPRMVRSGCTAVQADLSVFDRRCLFVQRLLRV